MCGIAGYIGKGNATEKLFEMLERLEYRGYDSAGIAVIDEDITIFKDKGRVSEVKEKAKVKSSSPIGIGHTRWATHGEPSQFNAHPHSNCDKTIAIVHNGIIENYVELKKSLKKHKFTSETDSEVIAHLIEDELDKGANFEEAFVKSLRKCEGSYAVLAIYSKEPEKILMARNESPLIVGLGRNNENFVASDIPAILPETNRCIILEDLEYGILDVGSVAIKDLSTRKEIKKNIMTVNISIEQAERGGHKHFMLKEILEEAASVKNALKSAEEIATIANKIRDFDRIYLLGCGTAYHAALVSRYIFQEKGILAYAECASEFRYSTVKGVDDKTAVILVSQSGETADTIAAAREAKKKGARIVSIVNVVGSTLARISDHVVYINSGPEIAVASTKVYLGQVTALILLALRFLEARGNIEKKEVEDKILELFMIPEKIDLILDNRERIKEIVKSISEIKDFFYIARRANYPTAMEGALKLKEISYLHAEAYPAGELKHGPLALMQDDVCVVAINPSDDLKQKMGSNIQEARTRKARIIELVESDNFAVEVGKDIKIRIPKTDPYLNPLTFIIPLHLLAYYVALSKGLDIDKPRNLAKSVTVE
jgi:glucosamine--fructose-6-phosphate aminotransferase (isomerizing)